MEDIDSEGNATGYYDNYGELCEEADARKVPTTVNRTVGNPFDCKSRTTQDIETFTHLMGLLTWM